MNLVHASLDFLDICFLIWRFISALFFLVGLGSGAFCCFFCSFGLVVSDSDIQKFWEGEMIRWLDTIVQYLVSRT